MVHDFSSIRKQLIFSPAPSKKKNLPQSAKAISPPSRPVQFPEVNFDNTPSPGVLVEVRNLSPSLRVTPPLTSESETPTSVLRSPKGDENRGLALRWGDGKKGRTAALQDAFRSASAATTPTSTTSNTANHDDKDELEESIQPPKKKHKNKDLSPIHPRVVSGPDRTDGATPTAESVDFFSAPLEEATPKSRKKKKKKKKSPASLEPTPEIKEIDKVHEPEVFATISTEDFPLPPISPPRDTENFENDIEREAEVVVPESPLLASPARVTKSLLEKEDELLNTPEIGNNHFATEIVNPFSTGRGVDRIEEPTPYDAEKEFVEEEPSVMEPAEEVEDEPSNEDNSLSDIDLDAPTETTSTDLSVEEVSEVGRKKKGRKKRKPKMEDASTTPTKPGSIDPPPSAPPAPSHELPPSHHPSVPQMPSYYGQMPPYSHHPQMYYGREMQPMYPPRYPQRYGHPSNPMYPPTSPAPTRRGYPGMDQSNSPLTPTSRLVEVPDVKEVEVIHPHTGQVSSEILLSRRTKDEGEETQKGLRLFLSHERPELGLRCGRMTLQPGSLKTLSTLDIETSLAFTVIRGMILTHVNNVFNIARAGDILVVPRGAQYSFENRTKNTVLITWVAVDVPVPQAYPYGEMEIPPYMMQ